MQKKEMRLPVAIDKANEFAERRLKAMREAGLDIPPDEAPKIKGEIVQFTLNCLKTDYRLVDC